MTETRPQERRGTGLFGAKIIVVLLVAMWGLEFLDVVLPIDMDLWGIQPRQITGALGIPVSPLLHADFAHVLSNTVPFLVLGLLVVWRARSDAALVLTAIVLLGGAGVWLIAPANTVTIGASGMVFGFLGYLLTVGIWTRHWLDVAVAVVVLLLYGSLLLGALPFGVSGGVSWQAHLTGFAAGVVAAWWTESRRPPEPSAGPAPV